MDDVTTESILESTTEEDADYVDGSATTAQDEGDMQPLPPVDGASNRAAALVQFQVDPTSGSLVGMETSEDDVPAQGVGVTSEQSDELDDMISNSGSFLHSVAPSFRKYPDAFDPGYHFVNVTGTRSLNVYNCPLYECMYELVQSVALTQCILRRRLFSVPALRVSVYCATHGAGIHEHPLHCWQFLVCGSYFGGPKEGYCYPGRRYRPMYRGCVHDKSCIYGKTFRHFISFEFQFQDKNRVFYVS